mmetsp:Transcript_23277/g.41718  ORF Transcript_23277/g.41718 Transcript_23277/m.41718 type:complete len:130 (+) Transcript_23277:1071-1460(+)
MQSNPQPTKLQRTGNKSGRWVGGEIIHSAKCSRIMTIHESVGMYFVMYWSENMSAPSNDDNCDDGGFAMLLMQINTTTQQTYASPNRSITSKGHNVHVARMEKKYTKFGASNANNDRGASAIMIPFSCT